MPHPSHPAVEPELFVVMPLHNEQESVRRVVLEWLAELKKWTDDFVFYVIDDGSTDGSAEVLRSLQEEHGVRLEVLLRENRGHGQSCLQGYRTAMERRVPYVVQIDSDGQCDPRFFGRFWQMRSVYDVIYGRRKSRDDGWKRTFASWVVRVFLLVFFRVNCEDANVPYRLMRTEILGPALVRIPPDFLLANIALALLLRRNPAVRHGSIPIRFRARYGGEPSVRFGAFAARARGLYRQLRSMLEPTQEAQGTAAGHTL